MSIILDTFRGVLSPGILYTGYKSIIIIEISLVFKCNAHNWTNDGHIIKNIVSFCLELFEDELDYVVTFGLNASIICIKYANEAQIISI